MSLIDSFGNEHTATARGNTRGFSDLDVLAQEAATEFVTRVIGHSNCDLGWIDYGEMV